MAAAKGQWRFSLEEDVRPAWRGPDMIVVRATLSRREGAGYEVIAYESAFSSMRLRALFRHRGVDPMVMALWSASSEVIAIIRRPYRNISVAGGTGHDVSHTFVAMEQGLLRAGIIRPEEVGPAGIDTVLERMLEVDEMDVRDMDDLIRALRAFSPADHVQLLVDDQLVEAFRGDDAGTIQIDVD